MYVTKKKKLRKRKNNLKQNDSLLKTIFTEKNDNIPKFFSNIENLKIKNNNDRIYKVLLGFLNYLLTSESNKISDYFAYLLGTKWINKDVKIKIINKFRNDYYYLIYNQINKLLESKTFSITTKVQGVKSIIAQTVGTQYVKPKYLNVWEKIAKVKLDEYDKLIRILDEFLEVLKTSRSSNRDPTIKKTEFYKSILLSLKYIKTTINKPNNPLKRNNSKNFPKSNKNTSRKNLVNTPRNTSRKNSVNIPRNTSRNVNCGDNIRKIIEKVKEKTKTSWSFKPSSRKRRKQYNEISDKLKEIRNGINNNKNLKCQKKVEQIELLQNLILIMDKGKEKKIRKEMKD